MRKLLALVSLVGACGGTEADTTLDASAGFDARTDPCDVHLAPSADDQTTVQTALSNAIAGQTLCLAAGTYSFTDELALNTDGISLLGAGMDETILDFAGQETGGNGIKVQNVEGFRIQGMTLVDMAGDGVRVDRGTNLVFRQLRIYWRGGSASDNGAYAVYPTQSENILIEDCMVAGASDAALYVGQSSSIVVRRNVVTSSVAGIEIENSTNAEVSHNTTVDNVSGILVFNLPGLPVKDGARTLVHDNKVFFNNRPQFAVTGNFVANVPPGSGIVVFSADETEVRDNEIVGHRSVGVVVVSCFSMAEFVDSLNCDDPGFDGYPEGIWIHDNLFRDNGYDAGQTFYELFQETTPFEEILWDGAVKADQTVQDHLCVQDNGDADFRNADAEHWNTPEHNMTTDPTPNDCARTPLPGVELDL
jgi:parallel beta-helix repeat protein